MGQKVNAIGLRLGVNRSWESNWFIEGRNYGALLHKDLLIHSFLTRVHEREGGLVGRILIQRQRKELSVFLHLYQPQEAKKEPLLQQALLEKALIKINGGEVDLKVIDLLQSHKSLRAYLTRKLTSSLNAYKSRPYFREGSNLMAIGLLTRNTSLLAKYFAQQIEKDFRHNPFIDFLKRVLPLLVDNLPEIKGLRFQFKGRLNGSDRSKVQWFQYGRIAFQTIDQNIDYGYAPAFTPYGVCGIKVWVVYETFTQDII
jgi:small subunit ribosomal protein S3